MPGILGVELGLGVGPVSRPKGLLVPSRWLEPRRPGDHRHVLEQSFILEWGRGLWGDTKLKHHFQIGMEKVNIR
jgi:hypothetical protein